MRGGVPDQSFNHRGERVHACRSVYFRLTLSQKAQVGAIYNHKFHSYFCSEGSLHGIGMRRQNHNRVGLVPGR